MSFELSRSLAGHHLIVQPSDAALNPPEVYFYVQDGLMIACGVLYVDTGVSLLKQFAPGY